MRLRISGHANEKMLLEGISRDQIETAIKKGAISRQTDGYLATYTYIRIAYKKINDLYVIKTVFVEK